MARCLAQGAGGYRRAAELSPTSHEALHGLCVSLVRLGRCAEAVAACGRCLAVSPGAHACRVSERGARACAGAEPGAREVRRAAGAASPAPRGRRARRR